MRHTADQTGRLVIRRATTLRLFFLLLLSIAVCGRSAEAAPITAFEEIADGTCSSLTIDPGCTDLVRDLSRTRQIGAGPAVVENMDATIVAENAVHPSFGLFDINDLTYSHRTDWLPTNVFSEATLTILAYDVNGGNDAVIADTVTLGSLTGGNNSITTSIFDGTAILVHLLDGVLNVTIDKHPNNPVENQDRINVFSSRLTVVFDDQSNGDPVTPVPEPASVVLFGSGLALAVAARARRRRERS